MIVNKETIVSDKTRSVSDSDAYIHVFVFGFDIVKDLEADVVSRSTR